MFEITLLGTDTIDEATALYRKMIEEYRRTDPRLSEIPLDEKSLRTMVAFSLDTENCLLFILYRNGIPAGFIDSARVNAEGVEWYIKAVWLEAELRVPPVFQELVSHLERYVRLKGVEYIFNTALLDDPVADDLWAGAGYEREAGRRLKRLRD